MKKKKALSYLEAQRRLAAYPKMIQVLRECAKLEAYGPFVGADAAKTLLKELGEQR